MNEKNPALEPYVDLSKLGEHYDKTGKEKVDIRQMVYLCTEPDVEAPDYDIEVIRALQNAGIKDTDTIVDIGCSYPRFLEMWQLVGHGGELIGIEPNTEQFNGLRYWQPRPIEPNQPHNEVRQEKRQNKRVWGNGKTLPGIELYEATADELPLDDNSADAVTAMFSASHWDQEKLLDALDEVIRVGKSSFVFAATLSDHDNKLITHRDQNKVAHFCSDVVDEEVLPPPPLHAGLTSERAEPILAHKFENVYKKMFAYTIWVDRPNSKEIILNAHRTQFDLYRTKAGRVINPALVETGLQVIVGEAIDRKLAAGQAYTDMCLRTVFLASPKPIRVSPDYAVVSGRAA